MSEKLETERAGDKAGSAEVARLRGHIRRLEALAIQRHDAASEAESRAVHLQETLTTWVAEMENRIAKVEAENARLRDAIDALHASTSWRVTTPLRWIRSRFR